MARTTAHAPLPQSASIPSLSSTLTPSASSNSLSAAGGSSTRLRSNSTLSGRLPSSPSDPRVPLQTPAQAQAQPAQPAQPQPTTPTHSLHPHPLSPGSHGPDRNAVVTPPPRPPRGPLRSPGAPRSPSMPSISTELSPSLKLCQGALEHSKDQGDTLDVSRDRKVDHIDDEMVEFFRTKTGRDRRGVWRLALSYNSLTDGSIVSSFSKLSRLRYLNLKGNQLTVVPPPLLELAALEILDLSKNQIVTLPEKPGRLAYLKVLSLSSNALTSLPPYLSKFRALKVFKVDHNPIQWPPREVLGPLIDYEPPSLSAPSSEGHELSKSSQPSRTEEDLKPWIEGMRRWLREEAAKQQAVEAEAEAERVAAAAADKSSSDEASAEQPSAEEAQAPSNETLLGSALDLRPTVFSEPASYTSLPPASETSESSQVTMKRAPASSGLSSYDEDRAASSPETGIGRRQGDNGSGDSLIHATASTLSLPSQAFRHDRSTSSSSVTPPVSASTASSSTSGQRTLPKPPLAFTQVPNGHTRGASYTATQRLSGTLTAKKSLPDLRQSHAKIIEERRGEATDELRPLGLGIGPSRAVNWQTKLQRPFDDVPKPPTTPRTLNKKGSMDVLRGRQTPILTDMVNRRDSQDGPTIDESRNSYFRRLSMLPPSTISKQVSPAMLMFVDSIRGVLFALTQLHSALRQYLTFAVPDQVAGIFARVLEPAGGYLAHLINALDRFDSMSRRSAPPATAIRGVVESAKESITVFGKVVAVLRLQTPAFKDADVRYTRSLLLSIYGGMSEIVHAWRTMLPLLAEIRPILFPDTALRLAPPMSQSNSMTGRTPISPILERGESLERTTPARANATLAPSQMPPVGTSPRSKSRRHAGSFSAQDVERGMLMGSPVSQRTEWPGPDMSRTIFEGAENREDMGKALPPFPLHAEPEPPAAPSVGDNNTPPMVTSFSQPARSRHMPSSSAGSSYLSAVNGSSRNLSFDVRPPTPASATLFDEDLLDLIETATEVAFTVWLRLAEDIGASNPPYTHTKNDSVGSMSSGRLGALSLHDSRRPSTIPPRQYSELVQWLSTAEQVTATLRENLMGLRANPFEPQQSSLHDNAQNFIKTVVKVSGLIMTLMSKHPFSIGVRQSLSRLTQSTREAAILIQVSSHRPGQTPAVPGLSSSTSSMDYSASAAHSSNEDLPAPSGGGGGLRGLHLPARHGLRNGSTGRQMNGANGNGNGNGHSHAVSGGGHGHGHGFGGGGSSGGQGHSPPVGDFSRFTRDALPQRGGGY